MNTVMMVPPALAFLPLKGIRRPKKRAPDNGVEAQLRLPLKEEV